MRIDAITTCVGEFYVKQLRRALPIWVSTLDSLTIMTDEATARLLPQYTRPIVTDAFTRDGAYFNKGAALNEAYDAAKPTECCLSFDADILPPTNWRQQTEQFARTRRLMGCRREGAKMWRPFGYFQLFQVDDPCVWKKPLFSTCYPHAGHYDRDFMERWPKWKWYELPFTVGHDLDSRCHWHGLGNENLTRQLLRDGVAKSRKTYQQNQ